MAFDIAVIGGDDLKHVTVGDGRAVFRKDDPADAAYLVKSGQIEIREGPRTLEMIGPGELFGEMALAEAAPRDDTAVAVGAAELIVIDRATFERLVREKPDFATGVMRVMAERLRRAAAAGSYDPLDARRITGASAQAG